MADKTSLDKPLNVVMLDALAGNDYSIMLCSHLQKAGVNIRLVVIEGREYMVEPDFEVLPLAPSKDSTIPKSEKLKSYARYFWQVIKIGRRKDVDLLHFQFLRLPPLDPFLIVLLRLLGVKVVYTAHNVIPHEHSRRDYWLKGLLYRTAHGLIVHSQYIKRKLLRLFPVGQGKTAVIACGDCDNSADGTAVSSEEARAHFNLAHDDDVMLFFGQIRDYKGVDLLIEAFETAAAHNPKLKLIVAGQPFTDEIETKLHQMIAAHPAKKRIRFDGYFIDSKDIPLYLTAADVVVLPYRDIDHSGVVHLAYAFAKPIIASDVGDFSETIPHGKAGYILPQNSTACLAETIQHAFANKLELTKMGNYAEWLNRTKYGWAGIAEETKTFYQQFVN